MRLFLGKIILFLLLSISLSASVKLLSPSEITQGEYLIFKIVARGLDIKFTQIDFINDQLVEELASSSEAYMIGTTKVTQITKTYRLLVNKSFTLPSFKVEIDGKILKTKAKKIAVKEITQTISPDYNLVMQISKSKFYIGEKLNLKIIFTYKDEKVQDYNFISPSFSNFTLIQKSEETSKIQNGQYLEIIEFEIVAKKLGSFILKASKIELEIANKGTKLKHFKAHKLIIYSNSLKLDVLSLPKNISIIGNYEIITKVDKKKVDKGEAVKMQLSLNGNGNINNLEAFTFEIPKATIYTTNNLQNTLHKDFEIISNEDFIIPSLSLKYFDINKQKVVKIKSPSYQIQVGNTRSAHKENRTLIETKIEKKDMTVMEKIIYFIIGGLVTLMIIRIYKKVKIMNIFTKESNLLKELKKLNKQDEFLKKIIPFIGKDKHLDRLIYKLEKQDKKEFKKLKTSILHLMKTFMKPQ